MNLLTVSNDLKGLSDQQLQGEILRPTGSAPTFLVLSELQRRKDMRADYSSRAQQGPEKSMAEELAGEQMMGLGQANLPYAQAVNGAMQPEGAPGPGPGMQTEPSSDPYNFGQGPVQEQAPQQFQQGGLVTEPSEYPYVTRHENSFENGVLFEGPDGQVNFVPRLRPRGPMPRIGAPQIRLAPGPGASASPGRSHEYPSAPYYYGTPQTGENAESVPAPTPLPRRHPNAMRYGPDRPEVDRPAPLPSNSVVSANIPNAAVPPPVTVGELGAPKTGLERYAGPLTASEDFAYPGFPGTMPATEAGSSRTAAAPAGTNQRGGGATRSSADRTSGGNGGDGGGGGAGTGGGLGDFVKNVRGMTAPDRFDQLEADNRADKDRLPAMRDEAKGMALLSAGLGILGGTSPHAAVNIGQGGMAGVQQWNAGNKEMRQLERDIRTADQQIAIARANRDERQLEMAVKTRMHLETMREQMALRKATTGSAAADRDARRADAALDREERRTLTEHTSIINAMGKYEQQIKDANALIGNISIDGPTREQALADKRKATEGLYRQAERLDTLQSHLDKKKGRDMETKKPTTSVKPAGSYKDGVFTYYGNK